MPSLFVIIHVRLLHTLQIAWYPADNCLYTTVKTLLWFMQLVVEAQYHTSGCVYHMYMNVQMQVVASAVAAVFAAFLYTCLLLASVNFKEHTLISSVSNTL